MPDFHDMPGHLIRRLHQISVSLFAEQVAANGLDLTPVQFAALSAIEDHPGIDQAGLAGQIAYDRVTIGGVVDRLVQKGYLARKVSSRDRRARELTITRQGAEALKAVAPVIRRTQTLILSGLDAAEQQVFIDLLRKATDAGNASSRAPLKMTS